MKTKKQAIQDNEQFKSLINAVINQIGGLDELENVVQHTDAAAGWPGFTYYADTHAFAMKNRKQIVELLNETAAQLGEEVTTMVKNFGVFRNNAPDADDMKQLYQYLGGGKPEQATITNVMAWFALEEVARMFDN